MKEHLIDVLNLNYSFEEWGSDEIPEIYWIGEIYEVPTTLENGYAEFAFILTAFTRGKWTDAIDTSEIIKEHFPPVHGLRADTGNGSIVVYYKDAMPVPTGEADKKRLQINFKISQWKGAI